MGMGTMTVVPCKHGVDPLQCLECYKAAVLKRQAFNATQTNAGRK